MSTDQNTSQQPSPILFFETVNSFHRSEVLKAAVELGVFTAIDEGAVTAQEIAHRCETSERGMRTLCDFLVAIGFLKKTENRYTLTLDSGVFLSRRSPAYIGGAIKFLYTPTMVEAFRNVTEAVRKGGTALPGAGSVEPENPIWVEFARGMAPLMMMPAELIAKLLDADAAPKWKVLDIAAGHGMFGITIAKHNPNAQIFALDWPNVLAVARENAGRAGIEDRMTLLPGSAFDVEFGTDYDLVLLTNFLHHFDLKTCVELLQKIHRALKPGGRVVTLEFVPNEDRVSPPQAATFSMVMLAMTPGGDAYPFSEFERMFKNAGFSSSELHPLPPSFESVVISRK